MNDLSKPFQVTLDPGFLQESMRLWRQATDMQLPLHDEFKLHFMQNRRPILANHAKTAKAWAMGKRHPSTVLSTGSKNEMMLATPLGSGVQPASLAAQFQGRKSSTRFTG